MMPMRSKGFMWRPLHHGRGSYSWLIKAFIWKPVATRVPLDGAAAQSFIAGSRPPFQHVCPEDKQTIGVAPNWVSQVISQCGAEEGQVLVCVPCRVELGGGPLVLGLARV
jgi:hypothetical protein